MFRRRKEVDGDKTFSAPKYGGRFNLGYYLNKSVLDFRGWSLALRHIIAVMLVMIGLGGWFLALFTLLRELSRPAAFNATAFVCILAMVVLLLAFLATAENKRRLLVWVGLLPPETRKAHVTPPNAPKMRNITRKGSYMAIGTEIGAMLWWLFIFTRNPAWETQLATYVPAFLVMAGLAYICTLHLDDVWYFRMTKFPAIFAVIGGGVSFLVIYRWGVDTLDLWWVY